MVLKDKFKTIGAGHDPDAPKLPKFVTLTIFNPIGSGVGAIPKSAGFSISSLRFSNKSFPTF